MIRTFEDFVRSEYPNHSISGDGGHELTSATAIGEFTTSRLAPGVADRMRDSFGRERVAVLVSSPPEPTVVRTSPADTDSMAEVPKRRPLIGALGLGIVALLAVAVVTLIVGGSPAVIIISAVFAAALGVIEGGIIFGGARWAGEKAWDQQNAPSEPIEVAAVFATSEPDALEACTALSNAGATSVRIVNETGAWHLPNLFTASE